MIGTSGYSYTDWVGPFYPEGTAQKDYLPYYAQEFAFTELNFTYYKQPEAHITKRIADVVNESFRFAVKAHQSLTHERTDLSASAAEFKKGVAPLYESGKLGVILFQFPHNFHYMPAERIYLQKLIGEFEGYPCAIEFRSADWQKESVCDGLRTHHVASVNVDEPDLPGLMKPTNIVTSTLGYVRFHGRNSDNWWHGDNVSRYDYLYSDDELQQWVPRIATMATICSMVMVAFNNHARGQAVKNAKRLQELLKQVG